jgi:hypothetical protein
MSKNKWTVWVIAGLAVFLALALGIVAWGANQGPEQPQRGERAKELLHRIVMGEITSINGDTFTVKPELPQELIDRLAEHGVEPPALPASVTLKVDQDSKLMLKGEEATLGDFKAGDKIMAFCEKGGSDKERTVKRMADAESARKFMEERRDHKGPGMMGPDAPGMGMGSGGPEGGPGAAGGFRDHMRPVFGKITKLTDSEVTIKVEVPDFVAERMKEKGKDLPADMPSEVTLKIGDRTRYIVNSERVDAMPFKVGDSVAAMGIKLDDTLAAAVISDLASAKARMEQGPGGPDEPGMGPGPDEGAGPREGRRKRDRK